MALDESGAHDPGQEPREIYQRRLAAMRSAFLHDGDGTAAVRTRSEAVDELLKELWAQAVAAAPDLLTGIALVALGGYGRAELAPFSDIDLLFCTEKIPDREAAAAVRRLSQQLWDGGLRASVTTRRLTDLQRFKSEDPEGSLALLDLRFLAGDAALYAAVLAELHGKRSGRDTRQLAAAAASLTQGRHARFGNTLFHLEPNLKDAPGGLRDAHVAVWLTTLRRAPGSPAPEIGEAFTEAVAFLTAARVFLHLRHGRDDNTLDWHTQDEIAEHSVGLLSAADRTKGAVKVDPAYWMRKYFRNARVVQRALEQQLELSGQQTKPARLALRTKAPPRAGFSIDEGTLQLKQPRPDLDPATDPEIALGAFGLMAETGVRLHPGSEDRIAAAIPLLSAALEDGPLLWARLRRILCGRFAADALRCMHALGFLDLILPEFHGIDALVIRDAYHRYTVDEHTFVLLEALHSLSDDPPAGAPAWRLRFRHLLHDLPHRDLLFLAALLHDTGKARSTTNHAHASAQIAESVHRRLELDGFDAALVVRLITCHLEMSAALRRDIFDEETVRVFAEKIGTHDLLRMLTLFTYADISAVHPDALTPWKAENLWRLWMAAENQMDRNVDQERIHNPSGTLAHEAASVARALNLHAADRQKLEQFLEGVPERYLRTHSPETVRQHMAFAASGDRARVLLAANTGGHELTVLTADRPRLFADLTGALSGWGMNIVSAEAFANAHGTVIDTFRFTDPYKTLEMNPEERERFRVSLEALALGTVPINSLLERRRLGHRARPRRVVQTRIEFDNMSSTASTLMQLVAQDVPGLLHRSSRLLSDFGCSVEVALIDTEGEMAIDVFYLTLKGEKLDEEAQLALRSLLQAGI